MERSIHILLAGIVIGSMTLCMLEDIRKKQIHAAMIILFIVLNSIMAWYEQKEWTQMAAGAALGICFLLVSICTGEKIGKGDALLVLGIGVYHGFWTALMIVFTAMLMVCVYSLFLLKKKKGWKYEIAFVPFLLVPYAAAVILQLCSGHIYV
ncbi:MAG: prepilin peptidase [Blautia sp.]